MTQTLILLVLQVPEVTNVQNRKPTIQVLSSTILPSTYQIRITTCKTELQQLIQQKREQCNAERIAKQMMENSEWESKPPPPGTCYVDGRLYSSRVPGPGIQWKKLVQLLGKGSDHKAGTLKAGYLSSFPGGPMAKTSFFQCRGPRFYPWSGN